MIDRKWAYYNEHDPNAAEWIRQLIKMDLIPQGEVDERSIVDVDINSIRSFCQHHFFCGIAVWPYALRQVGWGDDRSIVSGSAPCQSFSAAGLQRGFDDKRHLWPHMFRIIRELRPSSIVGEQVSSKLALEWWDLVAGGLESEGYATAAFDLSASSCGAPHHRSRLFWVAHANSDRNHQNVKRNREADTTSKELSPRMFIRTSGDDELGNSSQSQCQGQRESELFDSQQLRTTSRSIADGMADTTSTQWRDVQSSTYILDGSDDRRKAASIQPDECSQADIVADPHSNAPAINLTSSGSQRDAKTGRHGTVAGDSRSSAFWDDAQWYPCRDGKYRPSGIGINPLAGVPGMDRDAIRGELEGILYRLLPPRHAIERTEEIEGIARLIENSRNWGSIKSSSTKMDDGLTTGMGCGSDPSVKSVENTQEARIMRLKGYGNAIVAPLAQEFLRSVMEVLDT